MAGRQRMAALAGLVACLLVAVAIAGCGESSGKSASVAATTTAATAATTPTAPAKTPATTSTAAKPPAAKSSNPAKSSTTPAKTTTAPKPPAAKTSTESKKAAKEPQTLGQIKLSSAAFKTGGPIAVRYTCDGAGISPPLQWHGVPHGAAELFLLAVDLSGSSSDAIQWAVAGISPSATSIPAGRLPAGAVAGINSAGKAGWGGICGAKGQLHHVAFLFYALRHKLGLQTGFNPAVARNSLKGATLASGLTLATYQRP
jgi:phosphatidylethanolamine-binding protein (PEBP) family uncharacterized protein